MKVEVMLTAEGKRISRFRVDAVEFWEGVMYELTEEESEKWIPDFDDIPFQKPLSEGCGTFAYFANTFRSITTHWKRLRIY